MKILFIEDEALARSGISMLLSNEGHAVDFAESCEDAETAVQLEIYDVILLDINLPMGKYEREHGLATREAGLVFLNELRNAKLKAFKTPVNVPVVVLTALCDTSILDGILRHQNVTLIQKPLVPEEVAQMVVAAVTGERTMLNNHMDAGAE